MSVRIDNFVQVNIVKRAMSSDTVYDTAVFIADQSTADSHVPITPGYYAAFGKAGNDGTKAHPFPPVSGSETAKGFMNTFFANGGKYLHVIAALTADSNSGTGWTYTGDGDAELPLEEVIIFAETQSEIYYSDSSTGGLATANLTGIYQKIFIYGTDVTTNPYQSSGLVYKVSGSGADFSSVAAVAAYYTKVRINIADTIRDYAFTAETVADATVISSNDVVTTIITKNLNCDTYLAGAVRNIGGNDTTGEDITNLFMRIVLQQTLSSTLARLLASKIKVNHAGVVSVKNACSDVLVNFISNGYIDPEKMWKEDDLYIDNQLVVAKDTPIAGGYLIFVDKITQDDIKNHRIPDVYILYGDSTGVRKIVVSGEVF